jgi:glycosyltransferase involved in cell wall biosynthesis
MEKNSCSIIVCTFNRLDYLKGCLSSLLAQNYPEYEIIIVNDGSTDGTREFLDSLTASRIKVFHHEKNQGPSISRNTGIKNAGHGIVAFIDDDCQADQNWLSEIAKGFAGEPTGFVIGQTFYISKNYRGYFPERLVSNPGAQWPMSCNIAYRKQVFIACGDFDHSFFKYNNEDSEMALRAVSRGFSFGRAPSAIVYHQKMDWTVRSIIKSARNASVWPALKKKYPRHYLLFSPPIKFGLIINAKDYLYLLTAPLLIPLLLIRYLAHGKRDLKIFFAKWPIYLILRRYHIYREALRNRALMF